MSHKSSSYANDSAIVNLRFKLLFGLIPLKNSLEDGRGLDDLMDTQTTWMQRDYREIRVESRNARCFIHTLPIKRLLDDLEVADAKLMLLVYKLLLLVLKVNAASTKVTTAQRLRLLKEFLLSEENG
ncbi:hypothetical protein Tco_0736974 [Tanacetum coccineum]